MVTASVINDNCSAGGLLLVPRVIRLILLKEASLQDVRPGGQHLQAGGAGDHLLHHWVRQEPLP